LNVSDVASQARFAWALVESLSALVSCRDHRSIADAAPSGTTSDREDLREATRIILEQH